MARIFTYDQDADLNLNDKVIGSNSGDNVTKNFSVQSLLDLANSENFINQFDGIVFKAQDYNVDADSFGIITTGTGTYTSTNFSDIQTLYLTDKNLQNGDVSNYIDVLAGYDVRITKKGDTNNFGIYRVNSVTDGGQYKILSVSNQDASGELEKGVEYYISTLGNNLKNLNSFSVTSLNDVTSAGSGAIITDAERASVATINNRILYTDIINDVTTGGTGKPLSAEQGKTLKGLIDSINTILQSDDTDLDVLQEVVTYIKANRSTLTSLNIASISGLQAALDAKVATVSGKGLSTNDFTDALQTKLNNIAAGAEVNVQANWNESVSTSDAFIQNKPTDLTVLSNHNVTDLSDVTSAGSGAIITGAERTKLTNIAANAEQNVQANWTETDTNDDSFIQNKPTILDQNTTITISGTTNEIETSPSSAQNLTTNRTFTIGLPNDVTISNNLNVGNNLTVTADASADNMTVDNVLTFSSASTTTNDNAIFIKAKDATNVLHFRYDDKELSIDDVTENIPSGITSGGTLTAANNTQVTIAAGTGIINDLNKESGSGEPHPEIKHIAWSQQTFTCSGLNSSSDKQLNTWVYIDASGTINQQTTPFTDAQIAHNIIIGSIIHTSGTIDFVKTFPVTAYGTIPQLQEFSRIFGPLKKSGHAVTANGSNLKLNRAAGVAWAFGRNYINDANNPSLVSDAAKTGAVIHRYYADSSTGHTLDTNNGAGYLTIDPTKYDDSSGTLATVASGKFTVQRLYYFPNEINTIVAYYGKEEYTSLSVAEEQYQLESFTEAGNTAEQAIYLGAVIVRQNATNLSSATQAKFLTGGIFRSISAIALGGAAAAAQLSDLSDVTVSSASNNQFLKFNSSSGVFENATITTDNITQGSTNKYDQTVTLSNGGNMTITGTYPNFTLASAHPNISGASSVDNSGLTYIQDLTLDSNGHVTGVASTAINTGAIADGGANLATADDIHTFVTGLGYLTANQSISLTGDVTGSGTTSITTTIANDAVESGMLNDNIISGQTELASGIAATDELLISDAGTIKRTDVSVLKDYMQSALTFTSNTDSDVTNANLLTRLAALESAGGTADQTITIGTDAGDTIGFAGNVTVTGNLTVSGTTTTVSSETVTINDNIIVLNNNESGTPSQNGGIEVERGTSTNASLVWNESQDKWYAGLAGAETEVLTTASTINAATLNSQAASYYLDYSNFSNTPTIPTVNNNTITLTAGTGLSGGEAFTVNQSSDETIAFALDFSELTDMTADIGAGTEFILQNSGTESRKTANEISLKYFRNDITVTVQDVSGSNKYFIDGTQQADVTLMPGFKYRFTHPTGHPLRFSSDANNSNAYTTGVDTSVSGVTEITIEQDTPKTLFYYCSSHANMGGTMYIGAGVRTVSADTGLSGTITETGSIGLAINDLTVETSIADADEILFYDADAAAHKTITKSNFVTATSISGGAGMTLSGTTMNIDADCRDDIEQIGYSTNNYYKSTASKHQWAFGGTVIMEIDSTNKDLLVDGDVIAFSTSVSDVSLKENIETIPDALETVNQLRGVEYDWKSGNRKGKHDLGVIAQEVEEVIPHIVHEKELFEGHKVKTVDYEKLSAVLIEAVKELTQKVNNLEKRLEDANS